MKKTILAAMALTIGVAASAVNADELRVYINPGHGSWTANDRPCTLVGHGAYSRTNTDTLSFFESNTNLRKGFGVLEKLREYGLKYDETKNQTGERWQIGAARDLENNIVMSHVKCGPYHDDNGTESQLGDATPADLYYYNRNLSEVAAEVNFNNFDVFISIHSNAATEGTNTNYPLFLYRGWDNCTVPSDITDFGTDTQAESKAMANACWKYAYGNEHMVWTYYSLTNPNLRGDISFYGGSSLNSTTGARSYLGVLHHNVPGFLVEGYFHTYQPARHRAMNYDTDYLEGYAYARGIADYFGVAKESNGDIYGIVRDLHEKFSDAAYTANATSDDKYLPLNGAKVILKKDGVQVAEYVTDNYYNGAFVFKNIEAGDYTLEITCDGYKAIDPVAVTVKAATTSYTKAQLESESYVPPTKVYENYPDPVAGGTGFHLFSQYNMGTATETELVAADVLAGKTIRRQIYKDGVAYILALDDANEPYVYAVKDGAVTELDKTGIAMPANGKLKLSDIALTAEGVLVGCSYGKNHFSESVASNDGESRGVFNAYKWTQDEATGLPGTVSVWFTSIFSGNYNRGLIGNTMTYSGTLEEGNLITTCGTAAAQGMRIVNFGIADGAMVSTTRANCSGSFSRDVTAVNDDYELNVSPNDKSYYTYDGGLISPMEWHFNADAKEETILGTNSQVPAAGNGANYAKYAGRSLMAAPIVEDGNVTGLKLYDVTDGFSAAKEIAVNCEITPTSGFATAHVSANVTVDATDIPTASKLVLSLIVDGKMYQWTEASAPSYSPATGTANAYAYGLIGTVKDNSFEANYSLNAPVENAIITLYDPEGNVITSLETGAQEAGPHQELLDITELVSSETQQTNTWEVAVEYAAKSAPEYIKGYQFYHPRGVDVDNNMESENFGNIYCTEGMATTSATYISGTSGDGIGGGLYAFDAAINPIKNPATNKYGFMGGLTYSSVTYGADLARVRVSADGRIFVTRCNTAGDYICYAKDFTDLYNNDKYTSLTTGLTFGSNYYSDTAGNYVTGPNVGLDIQGSGEELTMAVLSKLKLAATYDARVDVISLGNGTVLTAGENIEALSNKYTIMPQVTNVARDNRGGIWYCQYRATPTDAQPALVYVDAEGVERYKDLQVRGGGGLRFSPDYKYLAVASSKTQFTIYSVEFDAEGTPYLQAVMAITHGIGTNVYDIAWDLAGNIYICGNSGEWMKGFALPGHSGFVTKAPASQSFTTG
ncbi:MAG: hypothetical protein ACI30S_10080, partial [Muribaculaceae bacterium]